MDKRVARLIASGFGAGRAPVAPGTAGSLAALPLAALLLQLSPWAAAAGCAVAAVVGWRAIRAADVQGDPGWVVIDEVAGQLAAVAGLARPSVLGLALAFALFRLLDVAKPGPVGWADRRPGAGWIMADDVIAGALAAAALRALGPVWPSLLG
jgi:phosphatidylglycerophosphatase A